LKLAVVTTAAGIGAVLLIFSLAVGVEPILRPLAPFEDYAAEVEVQVQPPPPAVSPPPIAPVTVTAGTSNAQTVPADRAAVPASEPERSTLATPEPAAPAPVTGSESVPTDQEPAEPAPIEEPAPVIEQPPSGGESSAPPPPVELPPVEEQPQVTRPAEEGEDEDSVVELATPPGDHAEPEPKGKKNGKS
jgi:hypothetical protein